MTAKKPKKRTDPLRLIFAGTGIVIAISLAWAVGWTAGSDAERRSVTANEIVEITSSSCSELDSSASVECISRGLIIAAAAIGSNEDLAAQQSMARWTFLMAVASSLALAVTAVGVWLLKRTLEATVAAVDETRAATEAMVEANQIARETTRAWLVIHNVHFGEFQLLTGPGRVTFARHAIKVFVGNAGKLPAIGVKVSVRVQRAEISGESEKTIDAIVPGGTKEIDTQCVYTIQDSFWGQSRATSGMFLIEVAVRYRLPGDPTLRITRQLWECGGHTKGDGLASISRSNFKNGPVINTKGLLTETKEMT